MEDKICKNGIITEKRFNLGKALQFLEENPVRELRCGETVSNFAKLALTHPCAHPEDFYDTVQYTCQYHCKDINNED